MVRKGSTVRVRQRAFPAPAGGSALRGGREDDDRDLAGRLRFVVLVRSVDLDGERPQACSLLRHCRARRHVELSRPELDLRGRVRLQVQVPGRMLRRSAERGDHDIRAAVLEIEQRQRPRLSALAAGRGEEQDGRGLADSSADAPAARSVHHDVKPREGLEGPAGYFFACFAARFSFSVFCAGFFTEVFFVFWSLFAMLLLLRSTADSEYGTTLGACPPSAAASSATSRSSRTSTTARRRSSTRCSGNPAPSARTRTSPSGSWTRWTLSARRGSRFSRRTPRCSTARRRSTSSTRRGTRISAARSSAR